MPFYTPLRYPGGKRRLAPVVQRLLEANRLHDIHYAEAYAGGAAIGLELLLTEQADTIHINDLARPVFAFWHTVLHHTSDLCDRIRTTRVSMKEWERQRAVYEQRDTADMQELGFAAFFLNRTNRSGIIGGGVIGGKGQDGPWKLDARFGRDELIQRIRRIGRYRNRITLYGLDALDFTKQVLPTLGRKGFAFYDPPYVEKSENLYLNTYTIDGHKVLARAVARAAVPWVVTYDAAAIRAGLFRANRRVTYQLNYSAQTRYGASEVMFLADQLALPTGWVRSRPFALSRPASRYPLQGRLLNAPGNASVSA